MNNTETDYLGTDALSNGAQWLTFILDGQEYGVDIQRVQEIKTWTETTQLPNSPAHIRGVINIRGAIVPIVDLRKQFSLEEIAYTATTVILVLAVKRDEEERIVGVVVDAVSDVCDVDESEMRPPPDLGASHDTQFIQGIVTVNNQNPATAARNRCRYDWFHRGLILLRDRPNQTPVTQHAPVWRVPVLHGQLSSDDFPRLRHELHVEILHHTVCADRLLKRADVARPGVQFTRRQPDELIAGVAEQMRRCSIDVGNGPVTARQVHGIP